MNNPPTHKDIYSIIKSLNQNDLNNLNNNLKKVDGQMGPRETYEIDIISIPNPYNADEPFMVYNNFDLVGGNIINELIKGKYPYTTMICSLVGNNTIIFHYQKSVFNNKKNSLLVSTIDENNNFLNQYLLVYNKTEYYEKHFHEIKNNFNNYIQSIAFVNNIAPITINGYKEIGFIIQLTNSTKPNTQLEDEYIPPIPIIFNDIKQDFISKPLIGLENIGANCYMNAIL